MAEDTVPFAWEDDDEGEAGAPTPAPYVPPPKMRRQRKSVSAECISPQDRVNFQRIVHDKSEEEKESIRAFVGANVLFSALDEDMRSTVVDAVENVTFAAGTEIITQGDVVANTFYIVGSGNAVATKDGVSVKEYGPGGSFGELALLYNAPRAATVTATTDLVCWALGRDTFRQTVIQSVASKREAYQRFLKDVPLLASLAEDERAAIADVLEQRVYEAGETLIKEGDAGSEFYLLEDGTAHSSSTQNEAKLEYKRGDYFGELALLDGGKARNATVTATTRCKVVAIDRDAFSRLLGNLQHILEQRSAEQYGKLARDGLVQSMA